MTPAVLTAADVARLLRICPATLAANLPAMQMDGFPPPRRIGRARRWSAQAVQDWLAYRAPAGAASPPAPPARTMFEALVDAL